MFTNLSERTPMSEPTKAVAKASSNPEENFHFSPVVYVLSMATFGTLFKVWARLRVTGKEHIPPGGGIMAVSNHQSMIDPFIVAYAFRRDVRYMGKAELFKNRFVAWFLGLYGGFPVDRNRRDPQALRTALNILKARQVLGMFPEGTRTEGGEVQEFHTGAIRIAIKAQVPIIPCGIWGAHRVLPRGAHWPRPRPMGLAIGRPITYTHLYDHHPTPAEVATAAAELEQCITDLVRQAGALWQK
jgi:1-acyl-sn-glycerol-3-phosphate acyltransferase